MTEQWVYNDFYLDEEGKMQTGVFSVWDNDYENESLYYAQSDGRILRNQWIKDGIEYYYAGKDGILYRNQWVNNKYYLNENATMVVGAYEIDGTVYNFANDGSLIRKVSKNGWQYVDGYWYYYDKDGNNVDGWLSYKNAWYYFDDSRMVTNNCILSNDKYYYLDYAGKMVSGRWIQYGSYDWSVWFYAEADGTLVSSSWKQIGKKWYYFAHIIMAQDEILSIYDKPYLFDKDGVWKEGAIRKSSWVKTDSGAWYYINADGTLNLDEEKVINGRTYYFYPGGELLTNTCVEVYSEEEECYDGYVYVDKDGVIDRKDGWKKTEIGWLYVSNGKVLTGLQTIGGKLYYLEPYMVTGLVDVYNETTGEYEWMFFGSDGARQALKNGWMSVKVNGYTNWYYIENGKPVEFGWHNGYYLGGNGCLNTGIYWSNNGKVYFFDENGKMKKNGWIKVDNMWLYADASGALLTGERTINGKTYWFDDDGSLLK